MDYTTEELSRMALTFYKGGDLVCECGERPESRKPPGMSYVEFTCACGRKGKYETPSSAAWTTEEAMEIAATFDAEGQAVCSADQVPLATRLSAELSGTPERTRFFNCPYCGGFSSRTERGGADPA